MKVQINGRELDECFGDENSLKDVMESLMDWSAKRRLIVGSCFADEIEFLPEDIPDISVKNVKVLSLDIKSQVDIVMSSFKEVDNYCYALKQRGTNPRYTTKGTTFCTGACNICWSSVWNLCHVTLLALRI